MTTNDPTPRTLTGIEQLNSLPQQFRDGGGKRSGDAMACIIIAVHEEYAAQIQAARAEAWDEGHADGQNNEHEHRAGKQITNPYREVA